MRPNTDEDKNIVTLGVPDVGATPEALSRKDRPRRSGRPGLPMHLPLHKQVVVVAMWPMLEQFMSSLVGLVDMSLAGHLPSPEAVISTNAVSVASFATWLMGLFQGAIGVGSTALISRSVGAKHRRETNAAVGQSMSLALVMGCIIGILFFFAAPFFGPTFGLGPDSSERCTTYVRLLCIAAPLMSIMFIGAACLRGAGDFRSSFYIMVVVNIVNIGVSSLLVLAPDPIGGHGVYGIAIGTVAAWSVGGTAMLGLLLRRHGGAHLHLHRMKLHLSMTKRLLRVGLPSLIEHASMWSGHAMVLAIIGTLAREDLVGSHSIAIRLEAFSFLPGFAFSLAAATMTGQYLGAKDPAMARKAVWVCWAYASGIMGTLGILFMTIPHVFVWLVTDEPEFKEIVPQLLFHAGWSQIGFATAMVMSGALRGAGDTRVTMMMNLVTTIIIRVPVAWFVGLPPEYGTGYELGYGLVGIWIALSVELMFRGLLFLTRFLEGGWVKIKV